MLQWFLRFPEFAEFSESSALFRENPIRLQAFSCLFSAFGPLQQEEEITEHVCSFNTDGVVRPDFFFFQKSSTAQIWNEKSWVIFAVFTQPENTTEFSCNRHIR